MPVDKKCLHIDCGQANIARLTAKVEQVVEQVVGKQNYGLGDSIFCGIV